MKIITLEEHFQIAAIEKEVEKLFPTAQVQMGDYGLPARQLEDLGIGRLQAMDNTGIDVQVLSYTASSRLSLVPAAEQISLTREINDQLAAAIAAHPTRFVGLATLPMAAPETAAAELERCVKTLGFKGVMVNGRANERFLDDPVFSPVLAAITALDVPLYLHPTLPTRAVQEAYYAGFEPAISSVFAGFAWGWHLETGIHALRMILGGVFDRYPGLHLILGHWGEMIPFYLARVDEAFKPVAKHLQRSVADYVTQQIYLTPSGMLTLPPFQLALQIMGTDHIMYALDYPFIAGDQGRAFLENAPISPTDKEKIAYTNAERLLKL